MENPKPKKKIEINIEHKYPIKEKIELVTDFPEREKNFFDIIINRISNREFQDGINYNQLSELLWYTSKVIDLKFLDNGMIWMHRPAPSSGGLHPIDIIVSLPEENHTRSFSLYNPIDHSVYTLNLNQKIVESFIEHIDNIVNVQNALIVWFVANPQRTKSKYYNAESLIWRDAGAYIYCFQLVATALDLNSCAVGSLGTPYISNLFGDEVFGSGGILIG